MKFVKDVLKKQIVEGKLVTPAIGEVGMIVTTAPESPNLTRVARYSMSFWNRVTCHCEMKAVTVTTWMVQKSSRVSIRKWANH